MKNVEVLVYSLSSPLKIGIYENSHLIEELKTEEKTSEMLPIFMKDILKKYNIIALYYTKGPGSFMAIKITYIFLKTFSIILNIDFKATLGFNINNNTPIPAMRGLYFVKNGNRIEIKKLQKVNINMELPKILRRELFESETLPYYKLPAV